eukprot:Colp12_sorted_trinity150504_noHs@15140
MKSSLFVFALLAALVAFTSATKNVGGRGFGDDYEWRSLEDGLKEAQETNKPAMIVVHKSWCGACKNLGPKFAVSAEIKAESSKFVLINVHDEEEPQDAAYKPNGAGYIPRILFADSTGKVRPEFTNKEGNPQYAYFYPDPAGIARTMSSVHKALAQAASHEDL